MALDKTVLKAAIMSSLSALSAWDGTPGKSAQEAINKFADDLSTAIDTYIKTGSVTFTPGSYPTIANTGGPVVVSAPTPMGTIS